MYDATNPLWREEHHYTGERRGPITDPKPKTNRNVYDNKETFFGKNPWIQHDDQEDDSIDDVLDRMLLSPRRYPQSPQQRQRQRQHGLRRGGGDGVGIGVGGIPGTDVQNNNSLLRRRTIQPASVSTVMPRTKTTTTTTNNFPIQFRQQQGRFHIDFSNSPRLVPSPSSKTTKPKLLPPPPPPQQQVQKVQLTDTPNMIPSTATNGNTTTVLVQGSYKQTTEDQKNVMIPPPPPPPVLETTPTRPILASPTVQMALSLDPFSTATLLRNALMASTNILSAMFGTIQLMGPMILAKRVITTVAYIFYDHYNGRYLRKTYTRRMQHMQEFEVIASARALGRFLMQFWTMTVTGSIVGFVMDHPWTPSCWFQPIWLCNWWCGMIWMGIVYMSGWGMGVALKKEGYTIKLGEKEDGTAITKTYNNPLSIRQTYMSTSKSPLRRRNPKSTNKSLLDHLVRIPRQVLQWMREPEEFVNNIFRFANQKSNHPIRPASPSKRNLDTFLFPSTWGPLRLWSCLTVVYCISVTLSNSIPLGSTNNFNVHINNINNHNNEVLYRLMRAFIVQESFHYEWYRVFVKERRIALGAVIGMIGLVSLLRLNVVVASIDKGAGLALIPMLIAEVVTWYMNTILYFDHYLPSAQPPRKKRTTNTKRIGPLQSLTN
ncbi:hypothetical protein IV203_020583 [Nitzschia inconspicua]|uniref:Uncharacterized protein n=1 Tax=Nitzschia inconspicua TaxID=303405 RepID=A0A9K3KFZ7_9STRA|nr:hypothetical protein IV203_020583 [Nitzschia inconspicua]